MNDYIKREDARKAACELCDWYGFCDKNCEHHPIDDVPAADVVERKKGEWIEDYNIINDTYHFHCSVCGDEEWGTRTQMEDTHYCPNCGADMREPPKEVL